MYDSKKNNWYYSDINNPQTREALFESLVDSTIGNENNTYPTSIQLDEIVKQNKDIVKNIK